MATEAIPAVVGSTGIRNHRGMPIQFWGSLIGAIATVVVLRSLASTRARGLTRLVGTNGVTWAALCRVIRGGEFLDRGRARRGLGPTASLVAAGDALEWRPSRSEVKRGDTVFVWRVAEIHCVTRRQRRDISGVQMLQVQLQVPDGAVTIGIFHQVGSEPAFLQAPPSLSS